MELDEKIIWEVRHLDTNDETGKLVPACLVFEDIEYTDGNGKTHMIHCCKCRSTVIDNEKGHLRILYVTLVKTLKLDGYKVHDQCAMVCDYLVDLVINHGFKWIRIYHFKILEDYANLKINKIAKDKNYDLEKIRKAIVFKD